MWLRGKGASASVSLASVVDGLGPVKQAPEAPFPFTTLPNYLTRNSQSVATLILQPSVAHWHALRGSFVARSGAIALPGPSVAHRSALRISGCGNLAGQGRWTGAFHGSPSFSPNSRTGTCPTGASDGVFGRDPCTIGRYPGYIHRDPRCGAQKGYHGAAVWQNPFRLRRDWKAIGIYSEIMITFVYSGGMCAGGRT